MSLSILNKCTNSAAKAIIFRDDGCVLMQQRDELPGLPFPGYWTFFGGLIEEGESPEIALERELTEELGCVPGCIMPSLFEWTWNSDWASTQNYYFPVRYDNLSEQLTLTEGQAMGWFTPEELVSMPLTSDIYQNFSTIASFLGGYRDNLINAIEDRLISINNLIKKNERVFYVRENPSAISMQQMYLLKELAALREIPVFRCCLHTDDQCDIHEMLMMHTQPVHIGPLKQKKTSLSYHMIDGVADVYLYNNSGEKRGITRIDSRDHFSARTIRLKAYEFRSMQTLSPHAIFIEVASGPFKDDDTIWFNK